MTQAGMPQGKVPVVCSYCGVGCNLEFTLDENGAPVKSKASGRNKEVNDKYLCIKGFSLHQFITSRERLLRPQVRTAEGMREVTWEEAIRFAALRLKEIIDQHGRDSIAMLCGGKILNEEAFLCQKFQRTVIGNNHVDNCARLCHGPSEVALDRQLGFGAVTIAFADFDETDTVFVIGAHTNATHPTTWMRLRRHAGNRLIQLVVADPRSTDLVRFADLHIKPRPGTDIFWIQALTAIIVSRGWHDREFCSRHTIGCDAAVRSLQNVDIGQACERSGVGIENLEKAAELIHGRNTIFIWGMGLTQHAHGTESVSALVNLALLTGNIGKPGCGLSPLRGQNNVQGAGDMGALPHHLPGHMLVEDAACRLHTGAIWDANLPAEPGLSISEMISEIASGRIRALYVVGANPAISEPHASFVNWMLQKLDLLIVHDAFPTRTAKLAHVLFPAAVVGEKEGTFTNAVRRVQHTSQGLVPPGEARPDWRILQDMARAMGKSWPYEDTEMIWEEVRRVAPIFSGITYNRLRTEPGILWPCFDRHHAGTLRLYEDGFAFRDRRARFVIPQLPKSLMESTTVYPYVLITGRLLAHYNTGEMTRRSPKLMGLASESFVQMHPQDAEKSRLSNRERVRLLSPYGTIITRLSVTDEVPAGYLFVPIHFDEPNVNILMSTVPFDPLARMPSLKVIPAAVEKLP
jgi:formate dehydrogenase alpha subunit